MIIDMLNKKEKLSALEKEIATYIVNHGEEISYCSIGDLAKATFSSNSSIIRLCRKCGCDGFKDFKIKYLKELKAQMNQFDEIDVNHPFWQNEGVANIFNLPTYKQILIIEHIYDILLIRNKKLCL